MITVVLPVPLFELAQLKAPRVHLEVQGEVTKRAVLDALEAAYPVLKGTLRDPGTGKRRPFVRFFACEEDLSLDPDDTVLPAAVAEGKEPFFVIGAMAGG
jgi:hypothetical protein